jgi:hypothetical protein
VVVAALAVVAGGVYFHTGPAAERVLITVSLIGTPLKKKPLPWKPHLIP